MALGPAGPEWWFEGPYQEVPADRVKALGNILVEAGDSLFGWPGNSQTWFTAKD